MDTLPGVLKAITTQVGQAYVRLPGAGEAQPGRDAIDQLLRSQGIGQVQEFVSEDGTSFMSLVTANSWHPGDLVEKANVALQALLSPDAPTSVEASPPMKAAPGTARSSLPVAPAAPGGAAHPGATRRWGGLVDTWRRWRAGRSARVRLRRAPIWPHAPGEALRPARAVDRGGAGA